MIMSAVRAGVEDHQPFSRHSGSFFLKMGAALFCVGHLVHIGLQLGREVGARTQPLLLFSSVYFF